MADKVKQKLDALQALGIDPSTVVEEVKEVEASLDGKGVAYKEAEAVAEVAPVAEVEADKAKKPDAKAAPAKKAEVEIEVEDTPDEDETPEAVGNMTLDEYKAMLTECMAKALEPVMKMMEAKADKPKAEDKKKEADDRVALKEALAADIAKAQTEAQAAIKSMQAEADAKIAKLNARLKELEGDTPRAFKGFQASESDENIVTEEKVKSVAPVEGPFINQFVGALLSGKSIS
jgi:hypothetical protein